MLSHYFISCNEAYVEGKVACCITYFKIIYITYYVGTNIG
jgi:hypothetical protein